MAAAVLEEIGSISKFWGLFPLLVYDSMTIASVSLLISINDESSQSKLTSSLRECMFCDVRDLLKYFYKGNVVTASICSCIFSERPVLLEEPFPTSLI